MGGPSLGHSGGRGGRGAGRGGRGVSLCASAAQTADARDGRAGGKGRGAKGSSGKPDGATDPAPRRGQKHEPAGEQFAESLTFCGRSESFIVAGNTFIPAKVYERFHSEPGLLLEGAVVHGQRVPNEAGKGSKWRAVRIDSIEPPQTTPRQRRERGTGCGRSGASGDAFSELVTFAGRSEQFVVAGGNTYVPSALYATWRPIYERDRIEGTRVANSGGGSSKWRATSVRLSLIHI